MRVWPWLILGAVPACAAIAPQMVQVPAGSFLMGEVHDTPKTLGGPPVSRHGDWDEHPAHRVTLTYGFAIATEPVGADLLAEFRGAVTAAADSRPSVPAAAVPPSGAAATKLVVNGESVPQAGERFAQATWDEAGRFCAWLSAREHRHYRLPTEAEWEYAARAASQLGLHGIGTDGAEWCLDWHGPYPSAAQTDPVGPRAGWAHVVRNGLAGLPAYYHRVANRGSLPEGARAGFRVVDTPLPATAPTAAFVSFPLDGVLPATGDLRQGPAADRPYFKMRTLWPIPPEDESPEAIAAAGLPGYVMGHLHSAGLAVMPNGDLLHVSFSSAIGESEDSPDSTLVVTRLRRGAEAWDMPDLFYDLADLNDQSALLWNDGGKVWFFGGGRGFGDVPFRFTTSDDGGATWSALRIPKVVRKTGFIQAQPITSAFRKDGAIFFGSDGQGASSLLWRSDDEGASWSDTGGRTAGRHTTFVVLNDGRILGMGGKSSSIGGYMPRVFSSDDGRTWSKAEATPFAALGSNQRPMILRLQSGHLFFAGDFQQNSGKTAAGIKDRGSYAALSADEGRTWHIKRIALARPHAGSKGKLGFSTLGYCVAAQAANGLIELTTSMTHPALHFELNEAWILSEVAGESHAAMEGSAAGPREPHEAKTTDGALRATWGSRVAANGAYVLDGRETWFYPTGVKHYEVTYSFGKKVGEEILRREDGSITWKWTRRPDGTATWTQFWEGGRKRAESHWTHRKADGPATTWNPDGTVELQAEFKAGDRSSFR